MQNGRVLIKRIKNCIVKETGKAILIKAYDINSSVVLIWLPKSTTASELKGYLTISRKIAEEKKLRYEEMILKPKYMDPSTANICNEFND